MPFRPRLWLRCVPMVVGRDEARFVQASQTTSTFRWRWSTTVREACRRATTFDGIEANNTLHFLQSIRRNCPPRNELNYLSVVTTTFLFCATLCKCCIMDGNFLRQLHLWYELIRLNELRVSVTFSSFYQSISGPALVVCVLVCYFFYRYVTRKHRVSGVYLYLLLALRQNPINFIFSTQIHLHKTPS